MTIGRRSPRTRVLAHHELRRHWGSTRRALLGALALTALVFGALVVLRVATGIPIAELTRDPLGNTEHPWYKGLVSNLGVIVLAGTAGVALFARAVGGAAPRARASAGFILAGGLVTIVLLLDDLYMLHETVFPEHIGIPENAVYATYAAMLAGFTVAFRDRIRAEDPLLLAGALAGLACSVLLDLIASVVSVPAYYVLEDGGKFFGILCWAAFITRASARHLQRALGAPPAR